MMYQVIGTEITRLLLGFMLIGLGSMMCLMFAVALGATDLNISSVFVFDFPCLSDSQCENF